MADRLSAERRLLEEVSGHCDAWVAAQYAQMLAAVAPRPVVRPTLSLEDMGRYFELTEPEVMVTYRRRLVR